MANVIDSVPTSFDLPPFGGRWFQWADVSQCFWPGRGRRRMLVNPELAPVCFQGGVYCFAWSQQSPRTVGPTAAEVKYIGQTGEFHRRMREFGTSAGFRGKRCNGHSAAWNWPLGREEHAWVSFFVLGGSLLPHMAEGMRHWMEAVALEEYRLVRGHLPEVNETKSELAEFTL
jgi:hypothetical protein